METEKIIFFRNLFFKCFIIGVLFGILYVAGTIVFWNSYLMSWVENFFKISEKDLGYMVLNFFVNIRLILAFFMLIPALLKPPNRWA